MKLADMQPGEALDMLVAEKLFGMKFCTKDRFGHLAMECDGPYHNYEDADGLEHYSTDISKAWQVVEKLRPGKFVWIKDCGGFGWRVEILSTSPTDVQIDFAETADSAPLAICRAALRVLGVD